MVAVVEVPASGFRHIALRGEITSSNAESFENDLVAALAGHEAGNCVLDLSGLTYTSSAGLRVLLALAKRVRNAGGQLVFCAAQPGVFRVFELSGFTRILTFVSDVAAARDRLPAG